MFLILILNILITLFPINADESIYLQHTELNSLSEISLKTLNQIQECTHNMFVHDSPQLIVDWTPKAACTCIWSMLLESYGLLDEALMYNDRIHRYRQDVYHKRHPLTVQKFLNSHYCKVKFVRDPYRRAVSAGGSKRPIYRYYFTKDNAL